VRPASLRGWEILDWFGNPLPSRDGSFAVDAFPRYFRAPVAPGKVLAALDNGTVSGGVSALARLRGVGGKASLPQLEVLIRNETREERTASLSFGGVLGGYVTGLDSARDLSLSAGETRALALPLSYYPARRRLSLGVSSGAESVRSDFTFTMAQASRARSADEWRGGLAEAPTWSFEKAAIRTGPGNRMSERDFNPGFKAAWDDSSLYLYCRVIDDSVATSKQRIQTGRGDQVHFLLAADTDGRAASPDPAVVLARVSSPFDRYVVVAPAGDGTALADLLRPGADRAELARGRCALLKDGYDISLAVPWEALGMPAPPAGKSLAFNVVAFDADGVNADHKVEWPWAGGDHAYNDPAGWGELILNGG